MNDPALAKPSIIGLTVLRIFLSLMLFLGFASGFAQVVDRLSVAQDLLKKYESRTKAEEKAALRQQLFAWYTVTRNFTELAKSYTAFPDLTIDERLLIARGLVASGQTDTCFELLRGIEQGTPNKAQLESLKVLYAWGLIQKNQLPDALIKLEGLQNRESLFLRFLIAKLTVNAKELSTQLSALNKAFQVSIEAQIANPDPDPVFVLDPVFSFLVLGNTNLAQLLNPTANTSSQALITTSGSERPRAVQVGYFRSEANAKALQEGLRTKGFTALVERQPGEATRFITLVPIPANQDPQLMLQRLKELGIEGIFIF